VRAIGRPSPAEVDPWYRGYLDAAPGDDALGLLEDNRARTAALLDGISPEGETVRYAPGKWSIREVVGHLADTERLFTYRALHFLRRDPAPLPSMDPDAWAEASGAHTRALADLRAELDEVRRGSLAFFGRLTPDDLDVTGVASGCTFTVRSLPWIIAGHELHHLGVLRERVLPVVDQNGG
jgi:uncharacterized damage-inducible protein DinB